MEIKDLIGISCSIITAVFTVACSKNSIDSEFVTIIIILLITIIYSVLLIYFYNDNKKNRSYGHKSDSDK